MSRTQLLVLALAFLAAVLVGWIVRSGLWKRHRIAILGGAALLLQWWGQAAGLQWQTMVFTFLVIGRIAFVMQVRSGNRPLMAVGISSNLPLVGAIGITLALQMAVVYLPFLQPIFFTHSLNLAEFSMVIAFACLVPVAGELDKLLRRSLIQRRSGLK